MGINNIYLPKIKSYNRDKDSPRLIEWMEFLRIRDGERMADAKYEWSEEVKQAFEELKELSKDPAMREEALSREIAIRDYYQRLREAREKGLAEGIEQGMAKGLTAVALKMKRQGLDIETIIECTGLTAEEIEAL